jgi:hypothetical protein
MPRQERRNEHHAGARNRNGGHRSRQASRGDVRTGSRRYCHVRSFVRYPPHRTLPRRERERRRPGAQAHANRVGRLSPRPPPRTGPAHRGGRERSSHHGIEKRTAAHPRSRLKRKNGRFWSAQFCTEVAHSERFELPTLGIEIRCSIQLSYECTRVFSMG